MAYRDLRCFLERLEEEGELHRVTVEVDPNLEIAAISDRVSKTPGGGRALFFEKVKGSEFPLAVNIFGSSRRMCLALECECLEYFSRRMVEFLADLPAASTCEWWRHLGFEPRMTEDVPCREIVDYFPDLDLFPFLKSWPKDSGRAMTLPLVFSEDPETGRANCGMYRVQVLGRNGAAVHWAPESGGGRHWAKYRRKGERMPVAIALGGDPSMLFSASLPLPEPVDEMQFAGFLRKSPMEVVRCLTSSLTVPANAEMIIEGFIEESEAISGSVFGNHTGFYAPAADAPVMRVSCITRRKDPVLPATVVGRPPMEDCWLAKAAERLLLPFLRRELPEIGDINLPLEWIFHNSAIVSVRKSFPGHAGEIMHKLRNCGWLRNSRILVIVDDDCDVKDLSGVAWRVVNFVDWQRDLTVGGPAKELAASASALPGSGTSLGIDATRKWPEELSGGEWPAEISMDGEIMRLVSERWRDYGF